jgi:hypothetical protein
MSLDERAIVLGMAILIDFDYFSHKSGSSGFLPIMPFYMPGMGSGSAPVPPVAPTSAPDGGLGESGAEMGAGDAGDIGRRGAVDEMTGGAGGDTDVSTDKWGSNAGNGAGQGGIGDVGGSAGGDGDGESMLGKAFDFVKDMFGGGDL